MEKVLPGRKVTRLPELSWSSPTHLYMPRSLSLWAASLGGGGGDGRVGENP